jgi:predicted nuclease of predicted toxin-antitoxin system
MKFLVDVNASGFLSQWLRDLGHDVSEVRQSDPGMTDSDILQWAEAELRIIITTDIDFEEMIWRERRKHCGLIRLENLPRPTTDRARDSSIQFAADRSFKVIQKQRYFLKH